MIEFIPRDAIRERLEMQQWAGYVQYMQKNVYETAFNLRALSPVKFHCPECDQEMKHADYLCPACRAKALGLVKLSPPLIKPEIDEDEPIDSEDWKFGGIWENRQKVSA